MNHALFPQTRDDYPDTFQEFWRQYPARPGNPKMAAFIQWQKRVKDGHSPQSMIDGAVAYARHIAAMGNDGTPFVLMAKTFLGRQLLFLEEWEAPEQDAEWAKVPRDDDELWPWAKAHGYPNPGSMTYRQYRRFLEGKVEERKKNAPS